MGISIQEGEQNGEAKPFAAGLSQSRCQGRSWLAYLRISEMPSTTSRVFTAHRGKPDLATRDPPCFIGRFHIGVTAVLPAFIPGEFVHYIGGDFLPRHGCKLANHARQRTRRSGGRLRVSLHSFPFGLSRRAAALGRSPSSSGLCGLLRLPICRRWYDLCWRLAIAATPSPHRCIALDALL